MCEFLIIQFFNLLKSFHRSSLKTVGFPSLGADGSSSLLLTQKNELNFNSFFTLNYLPIKTLAVLMIALSDEPVVPP